MNSISKIHKWFFFAIPICRVWFHGLYCWLLVASAAASDVCYEVIAAEVLVCAAWPCAVAATLLAWSCAVAAVLLAQSCAVAAALLALPISNSFTPHNAWPTDCNRPFPFWILEFELCSQLHLWQLQSCQLPHFLHPECILGEFIRLFCRDIFCLRGRFYCSILCNSYFINFSIGNFGSNVVCLITLVCTELYAARAVQEV